MLIRRRRAACLLAVAGIAAACGGDGGRAGAGRDTVVVFAAASMTEAMQEIGDRFEAADATVRVSFSFAGSSTLARQLRRGAEADVFVSADPAIMDAAVRAGDAVRPRTVARNRLALLVAEGNPRRVRSLADLARPGLVVVLCAREVPCGRLAAAALARAGVEVRPASLEQDVKGVVARVALGDADAGIVYATDVRAAAAGADGVDVPEADDRTLQATYSAAVTTVAADPAAADDFVDLLLSATGQSVLRDHGFLPA